MWIYDSEEQEAGENCTTNSGTCGMHGSDAHKVSVGKLEGKKLFGRPWSRWITLLVTFKKDKSLRCGLHSHSSGRDRVAGSCEHGLSLRVSKTRKFIEQLSDNEFLMKDPTLRS